MKSKWYRVKPNEQKCYFVSYSVFLIIIAIASTLYGFNFFSRWALLAMIVACFGFIVTIIAHANWVKARRETSRNIHYVIKENGLYQSFFNEKNKEIYEYYPEVSFRVLIEENKRCIRFRLDGSGLGERLTDIQDQLTNKFKTALIGKVKEAGYVTYELEIEPVSRLVIDSVDDLPSVYSDSVIPINKYISFDWKKAFHLLITGDTGTGKSYLCMYMMACMVRQGVRVVYCDPKGDPEMKFFMKYNPGIKYCTELDDIVKAVHEVETLMRNREEELDKMKLKEAEFEPIYLFFDELADFSILAKKKYPKKSTVYEDTINDIASMVLTGRAKRIGVGLLTQRADVKYIGGGIVRDNLGCRIALGQMFDVGYRMTFGENFADVENLNPMKCSGLIYRKGTDSIPRPFVTPYVNRNVFVNL